MKFPPPLRGRVREGGEFFSGSGGAPPTRQRGRVVDLLLKGGGDLKKSYLSRPPTQVGRRGRRLRPCDSRSPTHCRTRRARGRSGGRSRSSASNRRSSCVNHD